MQGFASNCVIVIFLSFSDDKATSDSGSVGMRWDLLVVGVAVAVILVGVVSIVGILSYSYRQRQKLRQRRWEQCSHPPR